MKITKNMAGLAVLAAVAAFPVLAGSESKQDAAPGYDTATEITATVTVSEVREVTKGALAGIHLTVKMKGDTFDVYLAPANFVKLFDVTFKNGQQIDVIGSRVKFAGEDVILAREIQIDRVDLLMRDKTGTPFWQTAKEPVPTGY